MRKKALISFENDILAELDEYSKKKCMGNRSMAVHQILSEFFAKEAKPSP